ALGVPVRGKSAGMSSVKFVDVEMVFRARDRVVRALDRTSLEVPEGQFACLVGPSGCGKSTLLTIGAGLVAPTRGEVLVGGAPAQGPGADRGMVFQSYSPYPWLSVRRNIAFGPELRKVPR